MRILAISHNFPNSRNANEGAFVARQFHELARQGNDVAVFVPAAWIPTPLTYLRSGELRDKRQNFCYKDMKAEDIRFPCIPHMQALPLNNKMAYFVLRNKLKKAHQEKPFDIIYARFLFVDGFVAAKLSRDLNVPCVAVSAGSDLNLFARANKLSFNDLMYILRNVDGLVTSGKKSALKIKELSGRDALVLHGVVDTETFCPAENRDMAKSRIGLEINKKVLLYLGSFKRSKGVFDMIDAYNRLHVRFGDWVFKICGYGPDKAEMQEYINEKHASDYIHVEPAVDTSEVHKWMQACDAFVLASHSEGMPNAVMEAMACGSAVVVTSVGGIPYEFTNRREALIVEPKDIDSIATGLSEVMEDENLRRELGSNARNKAVERFDLKSNTSTLISYFDEIIDKSRN